MMSWLVDLLVKRALNVTESTIFSDFKNTKEEAVLREKPSSSNSNEPCVRVLAALQANHLKAAYQILCQPTLKQ